MKLISMTDFVLQFDKPVGYYEDQSDFLHCQVDYMTKVINYAKFLKQPLKLEMFVPCDEQGNVLEEPNKKDYVFEHHPELVGNPKEYYEEKYRDDYLEWIIAKEKVLFNGFEYCLNEETNMIKLECNDIFINYNIEEDLFFLDSWNDDVIIMNLECLSNSLSNTVSDIELTESAIKQIGL